LVYMCMFFWSLEAFLCSFLADGTAFSRFFSCISYDGCDDLWLMATQPSDALNEDRVEYYRSILRTSDTRPIVLCAQSRLSNVLYILDGHHKAQAYQTSGGSIPMALLVIRKYLFD